MSRRLLWTHQSCGYTCRRPAADLPMPSWMVGELLAVNEMVSPKANEGRKYFVVANESLHGSSWFPPFVSHGRHPRSHTAGRNNNGHSIPLARWTSVVGYHLGSLSFRALGSFLLPTEGVTSGSAPKSWHWVPCFSGAVTGFFPWLLSPGYGNSVRTCNRA